MAKKTEMKYKLKVELENCYKRWHHIYEYGASDPNWEDGVNLNLVRNHIIWYKKQCKEQLVEEDYPDEYYIDLPEEVSLTYMARKDEIKENAKKSLVMYKEDEDYKYLKNLADEPWLSEKIRQRVIAVNRYVEGLQNAIWSDDYVTMRRHEYAERYIESFRECRKMILTEFNKVENKKELPAGQLTLFDLFDEEMKGWC